MMDGARTSGLSHLQPNPRKSSGAEHTKSVKAFFRRESDVPDLYASTGNRDRDNGGTIIGTGGSGLKGSVSNEELKQYAIERARRQHPFPQQQQPHQQPHQL